MANPKYTFTLSAWRNGAEIAEIAVNPIYAASLAKEFSHESGQMFFRSRLSGALTFTGDVFDFVEAQAFDTQFRVKVFADLGAGAVPYWAGEFWKTDCDFDADGRKLSVTPSIDDEYKAVLDGLDKEYNLIELAPEIEQIKFDRRPMLQVYVPGQSVIGCYLSGMWWEESCDAVTGDSTLKNTYKFDEMVGSAQRVIELTGDIPAACPSLFVGLIPSITNFAFSAEGWTFSYEVQGLNCRVQLWEGPYLIGVVRFTSGWITRNDVPFSITLNEVGGGGQIVADASDIKVYARIVCDVNSIGGVPTENMPAADMVSDNRNYTKVFPYDGNEVLVIFNVDFSATPTEWGQYQPGQYYVPPTAIGPWYPVARRAWTQRSIWLNPGYGYSGIERQARAASLLKDAYPISSVIAVLLAKVAPGITHEGDAAYSEFLYGATNPITGEAGMRVVITPKSNIVNSQYDQPAQQAPVTLGQVLGMLRDCFKCYWWIEDNELKIEHIAYFKGGRQYGGTPTVSIDLTALQVVRNGKSWDFARNKYKYEKPETAARYQFGWMDTATEPFNGAPIEVKSGYVEQGRVEETRIDNFSADIDYIMLNPGEISNDGFVLLYAQEVLGQLELPYYLLTFKGVETILQNGYASFAYLQRFWAYDMPAPDCEVDGAPFAVQGMMKLKQQEVSFPIWEDIDLLKFIKTALGAGQIEKLSVNLCSRTANATLSYDTESAE